MNVDATIAAIAAVNARIEAVLHPKRRKVLACFIDQRALSPDSAIAATALSPALHSALNQLRAQGIIKEVADARSYVDTSAHLAHQRRLAEGGRVALITLGPALVALAIAMVAMVVRTR